MSEARVTTGIAGLDAVLEGGLVPRRTVLVRGAIGSGKSTLAMQFLMEGVRVGEPGLLLVVDEKPRRMAEDAARFGWDLGQAVADKKLILLDAASYFTINRSGARIDARQIVSDLTQQVRSIGAQRLAIDTLTSLVPELEDDFAGRDFLRTLFFALEDNLGCTVLLTSARENDRRRPASYADNLASGLIELVDRRDEDGSWRRVMLVRKMRGTAVPPTERSFEIVDGEGIVLGRSSLPKAVHAPSHLAPLSQASSSRTARP